MHDGEQVAKVVDTRSLDELGNFVLVRYYMTAKEIGKSLTKLWQGMTLGPISLYLLIRMSTQIGRTL